MKKRLFLFIILIINIAYANDNNYILNHSGLVDERAYNKINTMGTEVNLKLNTKIFLDVKGNNGISLELPMRQRFDLMKKNELNLIENTRKTAGDNFVILTIALDQKHANVLFSNESLKKILDKNDILDSYVIPLLAAKDKNMLKSKVSAASLNGYAQIADSLASANNIELTSSIGSQGKIASTIWKMLMYTLVLIGIISYFFIILRERKMKNKNV